MAAFLELVRRSGAGSCTDPVADGTADCSPIPRVRSCMAVLGLSVALLAGCAATRPDPNTHARHYEAYSGYEPRMALVLAEAAKAVYEENPCAAFGPVKGQQQDSCEWSDRGIPNVPFRAALFTHDDDVILAFRGTIPDRRTVITDVNFTAMPLVEEPEVRVHGGFLLSWLYMKPWVEAKLEQRMKDGRRLWITGHSMGGAQAHLAAHALRRKLEPSRLAGVYTFAAPRVGDRAFRDAISKAPFAHRVFRFENEYDLVPLLPANPAYLPAGQCVLIDAAQVLQPCPEHRTFRSVLLDNDTWRSLALLPAHFLDTYSGALKLACAKTPSWVRLQDRPEECTPLLLRPDMSPYSASVLIAP